MFRRPSRALAALSATLLAAVTLSACAVGSSGGDDSDGATTLTIWSYKDTPTDLAAFKAQNALFTKTHPDVTIKQVAIPGDQLDTKLLATAATKSGPDIILNNVVVDFPALVGAGVMADLTDKWDSYADKDQFPDASVWMTQDDKVQTILSYNNLLGLYYNEKILNELGITPPKTLDDLTAALAEVKASGKYQGLAESASADPGGAWMFTPQLLGEGVDFCNFTGDALTSAFSRVEGWVKAGYLPKDASTWDQTAAWQQFTTGKYAFGINGNWNLAAGKELTFDWGTTQYPAGPEGSKVYPGGEGLAIGAFSKQQDLAWEYLQTAWLSKEGQVANYDATGQIPVRADVAADPSVTANADVEPFVAATKTVGTWPNNAKTAEAQNAVATAISSLISGQVSASKAADQAEQGVSKALEAGGGSC